MGLRHVQGQRAENATWPHASTLARTAQRREHVGFRRPLWWSARRQLFGHSPSHGSTGHESSPEALVAGKQAQGARRSW